METCSLRPNQDVAVIAAVASNGVIGANGGIPWRLPEDLRRFRAITSGHSIVMGFRTWDSMGRALPDRQNIVVGRRGVSFAGGVEFVESLDEALQVAALPNPVFVIGGVQLYSVALRVARYLYLTEIHKDFEGDVFFPNIEPTEWIEVCRLRRDIDCGDGLSYDFVDYVRRPTLTEA